MLYFGTSCLGFFLLAFNRFSRYHKSKATTFFKRAQAKQLLQDLCRMKLQWDDPVPSEQKVYWEKWLVDFPHLYQFSVGCCIKPVGLNVISSSQLHHFLDASEVGFGSVSYLCLVNNQGDIHCSSLCCCYCRSKIHEQFADEQLQSYARENGLVTKE